MRVFRAGPMVVAFWAVIAVAGLLCCLALAMAAVGTALPPAQWGWDTARAALWLAVLSLAGLRLGLSGWAWMQLSRRSRVTLGDREVLFEIHGLESVRVGWERIERLTHSRAALPRRHLYTIHTADRQHTFFAPLCPKAKQVAQAIAERRGLRVEEA